MKPSIPAKPRTKRLLPTSARSSGTDEKAFAEVAEMIQAARERTLAAVNTALVDLYWRVGGYISRKLETAAWGEGVVTELAGYIQRRHPGTAQDGNRMTELSRRPPCPL